MTWVVMVFVLIGAAVVQTVMPAYVLLGQAKFPFLLAVVLYYSLNREIHVMLIAGFLAGFLHDALGYIPLGYSAFCFCAVGLIASRFRKLVMAESLVTQTFFGGLSGVIVTVCLYIMLANEGLVTCRAGWVAVKTVGTGILGMLCAPVTFFVIGRLDRLVGNIYVGESIDGVE